MKHILSNKYCNILLDACNRTNASMFSDFLQSPEHRQHEYCRSDHWLWTVWIYGQIRFRFYMQCIRSVSMSYHVQVCYRRQQDTTHEWFKMLYLFSWLMFNWLIRLVSNWYATFLESLTFNCFIYFVVIFYLSNMQSVKKPFIRTWLIS